MKYLIIPDIHEDFSRAQEIIDFHKDAVDKIVLLGDYFDSFHWENETSHFIKFLFWVRDIVQQNNVIPLLGNHDVHYYSPLNRYMCSGFKDYKLELIQKYLNENFWKSLQMIVTIESERHVYALSHAGLHPKLLGQILPYMSKREEAVEIIKQLNEHVKHAFMRRLQNKFLNVGQIYGGPQEFGGLTWLRFHEMEDVPGLRQIVGHTCAKEIRHSGNNVCIDTALEHYMIIDTETGEEREY